ncbi:MAG: TPM domain-containing protein [Lachnospiraceae bacterium]|nr:TPM domain-containing protein [Lachnospiraceae bacterium]
MKSRILSIFFALFILACTVSPVLSAFAADSERVYDYAGILNTMEENSLRERIAVLQDELQTDIIILTSSSMGGKSWEAYADDFYDNHAFGYEQPHGTGIIFLISMDSSNRGITITTSGHAIERYTDGEIEWMYDDIIEYMKSGDYFGGCKCFLRLVDEFADNSYNAENGYYDEQQNDWVEIVPEKEPLLKRVFSFGKVVVRSFVSMLAAIIPVLFMRSKAGTPTTVNSQTYLKNRRLDYRIKNDVHTGTTERKRRIVTDDGGRSGGYSGGSFSHSSTHTSSGGFSHGGGGGRGF